MIAKTMRILPISLSAGVRTRETSPSVSLSTFRPTSELLCSRNQA